MQARVSTASLRVTWNNGDCCDVLSRGDMPTYEFLCKKCKKVFEVSISITEYERKKKRALSVLSAEARRFCNSSPAFRSRPPRKAESDQSLRRQTCNPVQGQFITPLSAR